jgi:hypothetical protein
MARVKATARKSAGKFAAIKKLIRGSERKPAGRKEVPVTSAAGAQARRTARRGFKALR